MNLKRLFDAPEWFDREVLRGSLTRAALARTHRWAERLHGTVVLIAIGGGVWAAAGVVAGERWGPVSFVSGFAPLSFMQWVVLVVMLGPLCLVLEVVAAVLLVRVIRLVRGRARDTYVNALQGISGHGVPAFAAPGLLLMGTDSVGVVSYFYPIVWFVVIGLAAGQAYVSPLFILSREEERRARLNKAIDLSRSEVSIGGGAVRFQLPDPTKHGRAATFSVIPTEFPFRGFATPEDFAAVWSDLWATYNTRSGAFYDWVAHQAQVLVDDIDRESGLPGPEVRYKIQFGSRTVGQQLFLSREYGSLDSWACLGENESLVESWPVAGPPFDGAVGALVVRDEPQPVRAPSRIGRWLRDIANVGPRSPRVKQKWDLCVAGQAEGVVVILRMAVAAPDASIPDTLEYRERSFERLECFFREVTISRVVSDGESDAIRQAGRGDVRPESDVIQRTTKTWEGQ